MFLAAVFGATLFVTFAEVNTIGFTAVFRSEQKIDHDHQIAYSDVITNYGKAYDKNTGVFTAPKIGIYVFSFHSMAVSNTEFWISLYKNDEYQISAYAHQTNNRASAANTVAFKLEENDKVYIKTNLIACLYGSSDEVYTSFSGFMLGLLNY